MTRRKRRKAPLVTKTGKVLTDADIEKLAEEAERGYDVEHLKGKPNRRKLKGDNVTTRDMCPKCGRWLPYDGHYQFARCKCQRRGVWAWLVSNLRKKEE